jgi:AcrR family transcriptional regulator
MSPRTKNQTEQIRAERKAQILDAAYQVFSQKGFHLTTVADVAAKAEVSYGIVYHYYQNKEELFWVVFENWASEYVSSQTALEEFLSTATAADQLKTFASASIQLMTKSTEFLPAQMEFWSLMVRHDQVREHFQQLFNTLRAPLVAIIQKGIDDGEFREADPEILASLALAAYDGLVLQWIADPQKIDWQVATGTLVDLLLCYLKHDRA